MSDAICAPCFAARSKLVQLPYYSAVERRAPLVRLQPSLTVCQGALRLTQFRKRHAGAQNAFLALWCEKTFDPRKWAPLDVKGEEEET